MPYSAIIGIPLMVIFGVLIKIEDNGPAVYKQERVGKVVNVFIYIN